MTITDLEQNWESLGQADPLWAILYDPARKGNRWEPREFFGTGQEVIDELMTHIDELAVDFDRGRALDFGCGAGRLTQPLAEHFDRTDGVDIAASMIALAQSYNRAGDRCQYHHNTEPDLSLFADESFDLVFTEIVLQHMPPVLMLAYVAEFIRVLRPGGIACFDIPPGYARTLRGTLTRLAPAPALRWYRERKHHDSVMELHCIGERQVLEFLASQPVRVIESRKLPDPDYAVTARRQYIVQRGELRHDDTQRRDGA